jgi:O-antigen ligase
MVAAKPLLGFGWDRYESDSLEYFRQPADLPMSGYTPVITIGLPEVLQPLHDTYLAYAVELGLVGFFLWLASILAAAGGAIVTRGPRSLVPWKLGLLAILTFFLIVSFVDPHQLPFPMVFLMLWSGIAWGSVRREARVLQAPVTTDRLHLANTPATVAV